MTSSENQEFVQLGDRTWRIMTITRRVIDVKLRGKWRKMTVLDSILFTSILPTLLSDDEIQNN